MSFIVKNNLKYATKIVKNFFNNLSKIEQRARKTITFDNNLGFVNHLLMKKFLKINTYFGDKRSPWQKEQEKKKLMQ